MRRIRILLVSSLALGVGLVWGGTQVQAGSPSVDQALKLVPVQKGVDYDTPTPQDIPRCKISVKKQNGMIGWLVEDGNGRTLRRFLDTNGDNTVDTWCYYKDGLEVYRDIDENFNNKADQYRWFNIGGTRWGIDTNEDGVIDSWKRISPEEVTSEIVAAMAGRDLDRFLRVTLSSKELTSLGLGKAKTDDLSEKIDKLSADFQQVVRKQKSVDAQTAWEQFSGSRPGVVPAGTDESTKDLNVYENVIAIVLSSGKHLQLQIGTLVQVGDCWKAIDVPREMNEGQTDAVAGPTGFFFQAPNRGETSATSNDDSQKFIADLEDLDKTSDQATTPEQQAAFTAKRAELLEKIATAAKSPEDRAMWIRQLTDMIGAAVQLDHCPDGAERLQKLFDQLQKSEADRNLAAYVKFRQMMAANALAWKAPKPDAQKIQNDWLKALEEYLKEYPTVPDASEAMLQLAFADEFADKEEEAVKWYGRIEKEFPDSAAAKKAVGARIRLESEGKTIAFSAQSLSGKPLDLSRFRGKVVLLQFWSTWSDASKRDFPILENLMAKYGKNFVVISVSVDNERKEVERFLTEHKYPWPQVFEPGGLDSPAANQLGILTVPTMMLIDAQGKVISRSIQSTDIEAEIKKLVK